MGLHIVDHPLVKHKLGLLRQATLPASAFRTIANELCGLLAYEATRHLELESAVTQGWAGSVSVERIKGKKLTVVPILRAGLGLLDGFLNMVPGAKVSVVGMFRDENTLKPSTYYSKLATDLPSRTAIILDPMLATGEPSRPPSICLSRPVAGIFVVWSWSRLRKAWKKCSATTRMRRSMRPRWMKV